MRLYSAKEVSDILGCKVSTLNIWYAFKKDNMNENDKYHDYAIMIPDFIRCSKGPRGARYWNEEGIEKLKQFQSAIPHGRNGILSCVTKRYKVND